MSAVTVVWDQPWNGGSEILSYTVSFRQSDSVYTVAPSLCDGSLPAIILSRSCTIASSIFTQAPFNLAWGSSIYAQVIASNIKGVSLQSLAGNGAIILRVPDAPINLVDVPSITVATRIGIMWSDGAEDGGTEIIDYQLAYALSTDS